VAAFRRDSNDSAVRFGVVGVTDAIVGNTGGAWMTTGRTSGKGRNCRNGGNASREQQRARKLRDCFFHRVLVLCGLANWRAKRRAREHRAVAVVDAKTSRRDGVAARRDRSGSHDQRGGSAGKQTPYWGLSVGVDSDEQRSRPRCVAKHTRPHKGGQVLNGDFSNKIK
jgi:hypothetical protein